MCQIQKGWNSPDNHMPYSMFVVSGDSEIIRSVVGMRGLNGGTPPPGVRSTIENNSVSITATRKWCRPTLLLRAGTCFHYPSKYGRPYQLDSNDIDTKGGRSSPRLLLRAIALMESSTRKNRGVN